MEGEKEHVILTELVKYELLIHRKEKEKERKEKEERHGC